MKRRGELARIEQMIKNDRLTVKGDFSDLLISDVDRVLRDYFDYRGFPELKIEKTGDVYTVVFKIAATSVRPFSSVPPNGDNCR